MKLLTVALLTFCLSTVAQTKATFEQPVETAEVSCESHTGNARSLPVMSPNGASASVQVTAKLLPAINKHDQRCYTTWTLHVQSRSASPKRILFDKNDDENSYQYKAEIDSWSSDGRLLLFSEIPYAGDWDATQPFVYDSSSGKLIRVALDKAFRRLHASECAIYFRPLAFVTADEVAIASGAFEQDLAPGQKPCFPDSVWAVNFHTLAARRISSKHPPARVGIVGQRSR
jgi:hypothetical protein